MVRRLLDRASVHLSPRPVRSARQRRRATDQLLTVRAAQLGVAGLQAYLADRAGQKAWSRAQVADELDADRSTVKDRLDRYGLRRTSQATYQ